MTREVLAEGAGTRATVDLLEGIRSVVDVAIYVWSDRTEKWEALSFAESKMLWDFRGRSSLSSPDKPRLGAPHLGTRTIRPRTEVKGTAWQTNFRARKSRSSPPTAWSRWSTTSRARRSRRRAPQTELLSIDSGEIQAVESDINPTEKIRGRPQGLGRIGGRLRRANPARRSGQPRQPAPG